jgi:hypothetical protein
MVKIMVNESQDDPVLGGPTINDELLFERGEDGTTVYIKGCPVLSLFGTSKRLMHDAHLDTRRQWAVNRLFPDLSGAHRDMVIEYLQSLMMVLAVNPLGAAGVYHHVQLPAERIIQDPFWWLVDGVNVADCCDAPVQETPYVENLVDNLRDVIMPDENKMSRAANRWMDFDRSLGLPALQLTVLEILNLYDSMLIDYDLWEPVKIHMSQELWDYREVLVAHSERSDIHEDSPEFMAILRSLAGINTMLLLITLGEAAATVGRMYGRLEDSIMEYTGSSFDLTMHLSFDAPLPDMNVLGSVFAKALVFVLHLDIRNFGLSVGLHDVDGDRDE